MTPKRKHKQSERLVGEEARVKAQRQADAEAFPEVARHKAAMLATLRHQQEAREAAKAETSWFQDVTAALAKANAAGVVVGDKPVGYLQSARGLTSALSPQTWSRNAGPCPDLRR